MYWLFRYYIFSDSHSFVRFNFNKFKLKQIYIPLASAVISLDLSCSPLVMHIHQLRYCNVLFLYSVINIFPLAKRMNLWNLSNAVFFFTRTEFSIKIANVQDPKTRHLQGLNFPCSCKERTRFKKSFSWWNVSLVHNFKTKLQMYQYFKRLVVR